MTRTQNEIIRQAIKDSELNGYKWTISGNKVHWSYDVDFTIHMGRALEDDADTSYIRVDDEHGDRFVYLLIGNSFYHDAETFEEGLAIAIKSTIKRANHLY